MRVSLALPLLLLAACGQPQGADTGKGAAPQPAEGAPARGPAAPKDLLAKVDRGFAGTPAPDTPFETRGQEGTRTLAAFRGKPVLVNLWATWCAPCIKEMPMLDTLAERAGGKLEVVALSQDMEGWRAVDKFFAPGKFEALTPHVDSAMAFGAAVKAKGLPVTILYDAQGREVWRVNGDADWAGPEAAKLLGV